MIRATTMMMMMTLFCLPIHAAHPVDPRKKGFEDKLKAETVKNGFFAAQGAETQGIRDVGAIALSSRENEMV
jgi:hypothetical protein